MKRILALLFFVFIPFSAQAQISPFSTWVNTRGSTLTVWFVDPSTGAFSGTYVNNAAGFKCQGAPYEVSGVTKGQPVTFTVNWTGFAVPDCKSITIWRGQAVGPTIKTRWTLDYVGRDGKFHRMHGADIFTRR
ncbi:avidin/streptavidin family protein [Bradyrhizobium sp. TZ2]